MGFNGGSVVFTTTLNAPVAANPANLGLFITSSQNLGNTVIRRGHQSQTAFSGNGSSILRYYELTPGNNNNLNVTLRFNYLPSGLNGFDANALIFAEKQGSVDWKAIGFDARNTVANYVEKNGINSLGRFTLSSASNALPVQFASFAASCNGSSTLLNWVTSVELNSSYFLVQRSTNGTEWNNIAQIAAAGNSGAAINYSYTDNTATGNNFYRIAEYDKDGKSTLSSIQGANCNSKTGISIWPNPASNILYIAMRVNNGSEAVIKLFDGKGAVIRQQAGRLVAGSNLLQVNVKGLAAGLYFVNITYNNGQVQLQKILVE